MGRYNRTNVPQAVITYLDSFNLSDIVERYCISSIQNGKININYSKKKIPIPTEKEYKIQLIAKVESFTKRMRWKALEFLEKLGSNEKKTFGFKLHNCPPFVNKLAEFELDLLKMVHNIEFRPVRSNFFSKLKDDAKVINNNKEVLVNANKSTNSYKMNKNAYNKYLTENITKTYKKNQQI